MNRAEVREEIENIVSELCSYDCDKTPEDIVDSILKIKGLAIIDEEAELPDYLTFDNEKFGRMSIGFCEDHKLALKEAGWKKVVEEK